MKKLFLTAAQARLLASDLQEYTAMADSSSRSVFKGFEISFGDMLAESMQPDQGFEMTPIPEYTEIPADKTS